MIKQDEVVQLLLDYFTSTKENEIHLGVSDDPRIPHEDVLEFMRTQQKSKLSLEEYKHHLLYFDQTLDDTSISLQGIIYYIYILETHK